MSVSKRDVVRYAAIAAGTVVLSEFAEEEKRVHRFWVRPWIKVRDNEEQNTILKLYRELLECNDVDEFRATLRMPPDVWQDLLTKVDPHIRKEDTNWRDAHSSELKLAVTMRYLALGDNYRSLSQQFRIGRSTVGTILREVCLGIHLALKEEYGQSPNTEAQWLKVAQQFQARWNIPHTLGAIDGKHVRIQCPPNAGSYFFNYKHFHSMVLLAVADADYRIIFYDVGAEGKASDGGIWRSCSLKEDIDDPENPRNIPSDSTISGIEGKLPYFFVGDEAFALSPHLLKPFPHQGLTKKERIFNYRLSRARRIIENTFGILCTRFRIYRQEIALNPEAVDLVIRATVLLHNMLRDKCAQCYIPRSAVDSEDDTHSVVRGKWRREEALPSLESTRKRNTTRHSKNVREHLSDYFVSREGSVPWQYKLA